MLEHTNGIAQPKNDAFLRDLLLANPSPVLQRVLAQPDTFQYQVIYTQIDRNKKGVPSFKSYYLNVDRNRYFNPASTVKLPTALAALEKLNKLKIKELDKSTSMLTDSSFPGQSAVLTDPSAKSGLPSIAHYIKKIFLVSDNDAYNRLYEFVGQEELNTMLWKKGYSDARITRRFVRMTPEENRHTNGIRFMQGGKLVYHQPPATSAVKFDFSRQILVGRAHYDRDERLVNAPMDFTAHNNLPLEDLELMLRSVIFPESVPLSRRFDLSAADYRFLHHYMAALPKQSDFPKYDTKEFFDSYTKFFFKAGKGSVPADIYIFNKPGWSYGFLTDCAYVADAKNKFEFLLSAVIYVNEDGILNDDKYEYEQVGYPFFRQLFETIYQHELERPRKFAPQWPKDFIPGSSNP
ncbi:hypothetical protein EXU57_04575 [Segetibacter sp. 3557_3]|nr:hypothetical protein EXU57_04575 [Segetibacter sp. 3557_3]